MSVFSTQCNSKWSMLSTLLGLKNSIYYFLTMKQFLIVVVEGFEVRHAGGAGGSKEQTFCVWHVSHTQHSEKALSPVLCEVGFAPCMRNVKIVETWIYSLSKGVTHVGTGMEITHEEVIKIIATFRDSQRVIKKTDPELIAQWRMLFVTSAYQAHHGKLRLRTATMYSLWLWVSSLLYLPVQGGKITSSKVHRRIQLYKYLRM